MMGPAVTPERRYADATETVEPMSPEDGGDSSAEGVGAGVVEDGPIEGEPLPVEDPTASDAGGDGATGLDGAAGPATSQGDERKPE
ncbi:MAG: hypothetical protein NW216_12185 [Hyphomicrobium sp.]|nr:hypothetical protein [Hyphomicrobium sp.]